MRQQAGPVERRTLSKKLRGTYAGSTTKHDDILLSNRRMRDQASREAVYFLEVANFRKKGNAELRKLLRHYTG